MLGLHPGVDADPVVGVVAGAQDLDPHGLEGRHHVGPGAAQRLVDDHELAVGQDLAAHVEAHGLEEGPLFEVRAHPVAVEHPGHGRARLVVDRDDLVELVEAEPEVEAHPLDRGLGQGAVGVAPGGGAVVELVDRRVEEVGGHVGRAVGEEPHGLLRVDEQALPGRDLARQVGEPRPEGGVELDVAAEHGEELPGLGRLLEGGAQVGRSPGDSRATGWRSGRPICGRAMAGPSYLRPSLTGSRGVATSPSFRERCPNGRNLAAGRIVFFAVGGHEQAQGPGQPGCSADRGGRAGRGRRRRG